MSRARFLLALAWVGLAACPAQNSAPCRADSDCTNGRCRNGACGPYCLADSDCGTAQVCSAGACVPAPQCSQNADCASGFVCTSGQCVCTADSACASNQACVQGQCVAKTPCKTDSDCSAIGERCNVTAGTCVPPCTLPSDCAPGVNPAIADALYVCQFGDCLLRCATAQTCGVGFICPAGTCEPAQCKTFSDCPPGEYCSDPNYGQCLAYQTCTSTSQCQANFACKPFGPLNCPPGFPCHEAICQELPQCLVDSDCALANALQPDAGASYCADGHCQPTSSCQGASGCLAGELCIGGLCVPGGCRGVTDCPIDEACEGGACVSGPAPAGISSYALTPRTAILEVGDTLQLTLLAYRLDGTSFPEPTASFTVTDGSGQPSSALGVTTSGLATAAAAGQVTVSAQVQGAAAQPATASITIVAAPGTGKRVLVVDSATRAPLPDVRVLGCDAPPADGGCPSPVELTTDASGSVTFSFTGSTSSFSAAATTLRSDGLPTYERVSVATTPATDLLIPLPYNWVRGAGGFTGTEDFTNVHTTGNYWAGFITVSESDPTEVDTALLLGDPVSTTLPGINQTVAVPGAVVLFTSIGLGIPTPIKPTADGIAQAGRRHAVGFAGRGNSNQLADVRSTNVLAYAGYMDYQVLPFQTVTHLPEIATASDAGAQYSPDYGHFVALALQPELQQAERTEVVIPNVESTFDTVLLSAVIASREEGVLPLGFSSAAAGLAGAGGMRPVPSVVLQSGAPYAGAEVGQPGIWAIALGLASQGLTTQPQALSARLALSPVLPGTVTLPDFIPQPNGSSYASATRTFSPGQPQWSAAAAAGATLAKLELTGSETVHVVYVAIDPSQAAVPLPVSPTDAPGVDPATESAPSLSVGVLSLGGVSPADALDLPGHNLTDLSTYLDGYSRFVP